MEEVTWAPGMTLDAIEKDIILKAFRFYRGNKTSTAASLGIAIRTLDNKLEKYEVDAKKERLREVDEQRKRADWLKRSRGDLTPDNIDDVVFPTEAQLAQRGSRTETGARVESASPVSEKQPVSMPERKEVQSVLPKPAAHGGKPSRR